MSVSCAGCLTLLHLANKFLVKETLSLLVERTVNGDNVTLGDQLLKGVDPTSTNLLLRLGGQGLIVVVQKLLAIEGLEAAEDTLTDAANGNGANNLVLKVILLLGSGSNIPVTTLNHLMGGNKVADENQNRHDDVLGDGDDIAASDLGDSDTAVGGVGSVEVDVVGTDASCDGKLELLGLGQTLSSQVSRVEWSGNDDLSIDELLVELGVLALLVRGSNEGVALVLEPLADAKLVLRGAEKFGDLQRNGFMLVAGRNHVIV
jgi:hypothetical protein